MAVLAPDSFALDTNLITIFDATTDGGAADIVSVTNDAAIGNGNALIRVVGLHSQADPTDCLPPGETVYYKHGDHGIETITAKAASGTSILYVHINSR